MNNSIGDFIKTVFSALVNRDGEIFKALFASNGNGTPGTLEKIFEDLEETRDKWCNTPNVYEQEGEMLEKTLSLFSVLERKFKESDQTLKWRNNLLYVRNGDTLWGDRWNIIRLFRKYFNNDSIYIVNNTDDKANNLLADGDFEFQNDSWLLESCEYSHEARFSESYGIKFENYGKISQSVNIQHDTVYFLHFFVLGDIEVEITNDKQQYWIPGSPHMDEFGSWSQKPHKINITAKLPLEWQPQSIFFMTDAATSVIISFIGHDGKTACLDYTRLYKKYNYPTFTLIGVFEGYYSPNALAMAPGNDDPVVARNYNSYGFYQTENEDTAEVNGDCKNAYIGSIPLAPWENDDPGITVNYEKMSYIGQTHITGEGKSQTEDVYTELLEIVRAAGIPSYIEILFKELDA